MFDSPKPPTVSVLLGSSRPGGLDISLLGLCQQNYPDFEVVFVDARYHQRHALVLDMVKASGLQQPFYHVPNHRYGAPPWGSTCAGYNTGFMLSAGMLAMLLCDYAYAPPDWISRHLAHHFVDVEEPVEPASPFPPSNQNQVPGSEVTHLVRRPKLRMVMAPHRYVTMPATKIDGLYGFATCPSDIGSVIAQRERIAETDDGSIFAEPVIAEQIQALPQEPANDSKLSMATGPADHLYMHTKNESFPLLNVLNAGGMDENYDRGRGPGDHDFGRRLITSGLEGWLAADNPVTVLNPRHVMPNPNIALADGDHGIRWGVNSGNAYYHATAGRPVANNPFDIKRRRGDIWHWRQLSQSREPVIERNEIPDEVYFKECEFRWPT